jgi:uncharacterized protein (TIGR00369 family)
LGFVEIKLPKHPLLLQHYGFFHGGIISYLADISGGLAGISLLEDPTMSTMSVELKMNFLKPGKGDFLIGRGKVIH